MEKDKVVNGLYLRENFSVSKYEIFCQSSLYCFIFFQEFSESLENEISKLVEKRLSSWKEKNLPNSGIQLGFGQLKSLTNVESSVIKKKGKNG